MNILEIRDSLIQYAGKGVFALKFIKKETILGEYKGLHLPEGTPCTRQELSRESVYSYCMRDNTTVIPYHNCIFRYINDIVDIYSTMKQQKVVLYQHLNLNVDFFEQQGKVFIKTVRDIEIGEELFIDYGPTYWDNFVRINIGYIIKQMSIKEGGIDNLFIKSKRRNEIYERHDKERIEMDIEKNGTEICEILEPK
jgi:SET domain-containing protein